MKRTDAERAALWDAVARVLKTEDVSDRAIRARFGASSRFVAGVRRDLGLPAFKRPVRTGPKLWTAEQWEAATVLVRGGHRLWRGRRSAEGTPMAGRLETAYRVGFRLHYRRDPVGAVQSACTRKFCVEPTHRTDQVMRDAWPKDMPVGSTWRGMDLVAVRKALRQPSPYPALSPDEQKVGARYAPTAMSTSELSRRLGCSELSAKKWREA